MAWCDTSSVPKAIDGEEGEPTWWTRFAAWAAEARSHRVILLVGAIWLLNGFDLAFTLLSHQQGVLDEQNPFARQMLEQGVASIVLYKVGLVLIGSYPLLRFRTVRITELGTLVIVLAYATLAMRWSNCYELYSLAFPHNSVAAQTMPSAAGR